MPNRTDAPATDETTVARAIRIGRAEHAAYAGAPALIRNTSAEITDDLRDALAPHAAAQV